MNCFQLGKRKTGNALLNLRMNMVVLIIVIVLMSYSAGPIQFAVDIPGKSLYMMLGTPQSGELVN